MKIAPASAHRSSSGAVLNAAAPDPSPLREFTLAPRRILWTSGDGVRHADTLLATKRGQSVLSDPVPPLELRAAPDRPAALLLDFGVEVHGYVELFTPMFPDPGRARRVRIRFGESASEAMAELGERGAGNDHAIRDQTVQLPWLGRTRVGPSGFRFVRIDNADADAPVEISEVRAVLHVRDLDYVGAFRCDDERLNRIWDTGAWTVQLNMQEYLWDGIKRDRLVWLGDLHPEVATVNAVFGYNEVVPRSLDLIRDVTPPTDWMHGISSYSLWWVILQEDWWLHHEREDYLRAQHPYLRALLPRIAGHIDADGRETLDGMRFLDWPTYGDEAAVHEGLQALMVRAMEAGIRLCRVLDDGDTARRCADASARLRAHAPAVSGRKAPAALLALAGLRDAAATARGVLLPDGPRDVSTFYGYYVLEALARAGQHDAALDLISAYWGGMLDAGATTFWEGFDLAWTKGASRIDELPAPGQRDLHGDFGQHCYQGFRHSLCHGWASGPTPWLSRHVLGIEPLEPGLRKVRVAPNLGRLQWAEGAYPTPNGPVRVRHERRPDGSVHSHVESPPDIVVVGKTE